MLSREVVERLDELLAVMTGDNPNRLTDNPGGCDCCECGQVFIGGIEHDLCAQCEARRKFVTCAVNALPELLRVYRAWLDAPVEEMYHAGAGCLVAELVVPEVWAQLDGQRIRLVRDGDSGEGYNNGESNV